MCELTGYGFWVMIKLENVAHDFSLDLFLSYELDDSRYFEFWAEVFFFFKEDTDLLYFPTTEGFLGVSFPFELVILFHELRGMQVGS